MAGVPDDPSDRPTRMADYGAVDSLVDVDELDNAADSAEPDFAPDPWYRNRVLLALWALAVALVLTLIIYGLVELSRGGEGGGPATTTTTTTTTTTSHTRSSTTSPTTTTTTTTTTTRSSSSEAPPPETPAQTPEEAPPQTTYSPAPTEPPRHHHHLHLPHLPHGFF